MIQIDKFVMGKIENTLAFQDKASAKKAYASFQDRIDCYAQVNVDGKLLNTAQARKYLGLPQIKIHLR